MKKYTPIVFLMLFISHGFAQKINLDSLMNVVAKRSAQIKPIVSLNRDSLFQQLIVSRSIPARISLVYEIIGYGEGLGKNDLTYHYKIINWAKKNQDDVINAITSAELGYNIDANGDKAKGLEIDIAALKLAEKTGSSRAIGIACDNLGILYQDSNIKLGKFYFLKGFEASLKANDYLYACYEAENSGLFYQTEGKLDSANFFFSRSFELAVTHNVHNQISASLTLLGELQKNQQLKIKYYKLAQEIAEKENDLNEIRTASYDLAGYYLDRDQIDSALLYGRKSYMAAKITTVYRKYRPAFLLAQIFRKVNADSALKYVDIAYSLKDSANDLQKVQQANTIAFNEQKQQNDIAGAKAEYQNKIRTYIFIVGIVVLLSVLFIFWRNSRQRQKANMLLTQQKEEVQTTLVKLQLTQTQLIQSEKMASLGELTAGIAHEIQNPLNFVNNFSEVSCELLDEMNEELEKGDIAEAKTIATDLKQNLEKIHHHGKRADGIVKGMLQHSRTSTGEKELTNINTLADEFLKLSYHGLRAKDKSFNAELVTNFGENLPKINVAQQDIGRVLLNLFNNAFYAVNEKKKLARADYKPEVTVTTSTEKDNLVIKVKDNGNGIPESIKDKIMQPFFTTKPTGEGTGLGLSLSYDIVVKGHGGSINVEGVEGEGSEFTIIIPVN